jgi:hypothetical protein
MADQRETRVDWFFDVQYSDLVKSEASDGDDNGNE